MRKGPGHMARMYGTGRRNFSKAWLRFYDPNAAREIFAKADYATVEQRWTFPIVDAAAQYLATVNQDPRNHFGKHALRRFDK